MRKRILAGATAAVALLGAGLAMPAAFAAPQDGPTGAVRATTDCTVVASIWHKPNHTGRGNAGGEVWTHTVERCRSVNGQVRETTAYTELQIQLWSPAEGRLTWSKYDDNEGMVPPGPIYWVCPGTYRNPLIPEQVISC